ncbi:MAG: hypothetical protein PWQ77_622 [Kosmotogales bacterium]|nr:hypothetical protein [Kosmotogales bacterium]
MNDKDKILWINRIAVFIILFIVLRLTTLPGGSIVISRSIVTSVMTCGLVSELSVSQLIIALSGDMLVIILFPTLIKVIGERWE